MSEEKVPKKWNWNDWPDLSKLDVFRENDFIKFKIEI